jgi:hypothetical protein
MLRILNASPGFGAPLSEQEIKAFLTSKVLNVHLGTVDEDGDANIHPAWYYYDPSKGSMLKQGGCPRKRTILKRIIQFIFVSTIKTLHIKGFVERGL